MNILEKYRTIHKSFIIKPNPYITQKQAEDALTKLSICDIFSVSILLSLIMRSFNAFPRYTRSPIFRQFIMLQVATVFGSLGLYFYDINLLMKEIPESELNKKKV